MAGYILDERDRTTEVEAARQEWFDPNILQIESQLDVAVAALPLQIRNVGEAFKANLVSARHAVTLPYNVLFASFLMTAARKFYFDNLMPKLEAEPEADIERRHEIREALSNEAFSVYEDPEILRSEAIRTLVDLPVLSRHRAINVSTPLVLRQATTETWTAFEVLASDLFIAATDANATLLRQVQSNADLAHALRISATNLADPNQWQAFRDKLHFNQLGAMRAAYNALLPNNADTLNVLSDDRLNVLMQRRHILVHQAGKVNQKYIDDTRESFPLGSVLQVTPVYVAAALVLVRDGGIKLLEEVAKIV